MNTLRVLYHLARADFLERVRRYNFLIIMGLVLILGFAIANGQLVLIVGSNYRGVINSAWVGGLMSTFIGFFLGLFGFYLVKGSIQRDYETGVGQIMATTPLKRVLYTIGKWLSNFAVLGLMIVLLALVGVIMQLVYREDPHLDWWALLSPFLLLVLPYMAFTAALAVLFESIGWLRGGFGNVVYFIFYVMVIIMLSFSFYGTPPSLDPIGLGYLERSMIAAALEAYPDTITSFMMSPGGDVYQAFPWAGIDWTAQILYARLALLLVSFGIAACSAVFFDRFSPSKLAGRIRRLGATLLPETPAREETRPAPAAAASAGNARGQLTPLSGTQRRARFAPVLWAEIKLLLKGQRWWWYILAAGLVAAQFLLPPGLVSLALLAAWVWPILLLGRLGCRESIFETSQMVFSAPQPVARQLPAKWLSAFFFIAMIGIGAFVRFLSAGDTHALLGWWSGAFFIPSLALASGVLTHSSKFFEVVYVIWMYLILQRIAPFDFMGMTPDGPLQVYALLSLALLVLTPLARQRQLTRKQVAR